MKFLVILSVAKDLQRHSFDEGLKSCAALRMTKEWCV